MKRVLFLLALISLFALPFFARAELIREADPTPDPSVTAVVQKTTEAQEISKKCRFTLDGHTMTTRKNMHDRRYSTYATVLSNVGLQIDGQGEEISGVFVQFYDRATRTEVQVEQNSRWVTVNTIGTHLSDWAAVPAGTKRVRLLNSSGSRMFIS